MDDFDSVNDPVFVNSMEEAAAARGTCPNSLIDISLKTQMRESSIVTIFLIFMCCNRFVRASTRVLKKLMKKGKKNKIKAQKKALKKEKK